MGKVEIITPA